MPSRRDPETGLCRRGTSNGNSNGSSEDRRRRKSYLLDTYRANVRGIRITHAEDSGPTILRGKQILMYPSPENFNGVWSTNLSVMRNHRYIVRIEEVPLCRCYRCGRLLTFETITVDRIVPGCKKTAKYPNGGTYVRENIRPACMDCNSETGGRLAKSKNKKIEHPEPLVVEIEEYLRSIHGYATV